MESIIVICHILQNIRNNKAKSHAVILSAWLICLFGSSESLKDDSQGRVYAVIPSVSDIIVHTASLCS